MISPYTAVGLSTRNYAVKSTKEELENIKRINDFMDVAVMVAATDGAPVRLIVLPEMAIQGMPMDFRAGNKEQHRPRRPRSLDPRPTRSQSRPSSSAPISPPSSCGCATRISPAICSMWLHHQPAG